VAESSTDIRDQVSTRHEKAARRRPVDMLTNGRRRCEIARGVNGSPLPRHQTASRLSDVLQLDSFFHQPVGQKLLRISQGLRQQTAQIGQDVSRKATEELRERLTDALRQKGHKL
jgi:hypothetical protein